MKRRLDAFTLGLGVDDPGYVCSECGYSHRDRRNFRRSEDGESHTCSTGHYVTKDGETRRQKNIYARPR